MKTQRLTIFLLQPISEPKEALAKDKSPKAVVLEPQSGLVGTFYFVSKPPSRAGWVPFVKEIAPTLPDLSSSSASGVLIVEANGRHFALTFGYGRGLLDMSKIERQFGLRVALNRIDPAQLRSMDTKTFERSRSDTDTASQQEHRTTNIWRRRLARHSEGGDGRAARHLALEEAFRG